MNEIYYQVPLFHYIVPLRMNLKVHSVGNMLTECWQLVFGYMLATCIWIHVVNRVARPNQNQLSVQTTLSLDLKMEQTVAAGASAAFIITAENARKRRRRWWQREFLKNGISHGDNLMSELLLNDGSSFRNFVRLTKTDFEEILCLVAPKICKKYKLSCGYSTINQISSYSAIFGYRRFVTNSFCTTC